MKHQMTDDKEISAYQYDPRGLCFRCFIETIRKTFYPGCPVVPTVEESQIFGAKGIAHACPQSSDCAVMCGRNKGKHAALPQLFLKDSFGTFEAPARLELLPQAALDAGAIQCGCSDEARRKKDMVLPLLDFWMMGIDPRVNPDYAKTHHNLPIP